MEALFSVFFIPWQTGYSWTAVSPAQDSALRAAGQAMESSKSRTSGRSVGSLIQSNNRHAKTFDKRGANKHRPNP
jgi:hypothetical protein